VAVELASYGIVAWLAGGARSACSVVRYSSHDRAVRRMGCVLGSYQEL
jgi:hypothetical protein